MSHFNAFSTLPGTDPSRPTSYNGRMTFILRLSLDETGRVCGVVERVRNGEKERFYGVEEISTVIARMVETETRQEPTAGDS